MADGGAGNSGGRRGAGESQKYLTRGAKRSGGQNVIFPISALCKMVILVPDVALIYLKLKKKCIWKLKRIFFYIQTKEDDFYDIKFCWNKSLFFRKDIRIHLIFYI